MQNWHDLGAYYAGNLTLGILMIHPLKSTTCADTAKKEPIAKQYRCAPGIIDSIHVLAFTALGIKDLQNIGVSLKKIC